MNKPKVIAIVGPTASGKTSLAIKIAKRFNGEIISADSRQVYRGLDIGSAKVTKAEMDGIPHHLLDVADPKDTYTAADFKREATVAMEAIWVRGKLPIVAGGTFFYIDTLLKRVNLPEVSPNEELRALLEEKSPSELLAILHQLDASYAELVDKDNKRRLIRAIEIATALGHVPEADNSASPYDILTIGITINKDNYEQVLRQRLIDRLDQGLIVEVETLLSQGITHERLESLGLEYRYVSRFLTGEITRDEMITQIVLKSRQFAKRQMTWLKRDKAIKWFKKDEVQQVNEEITAFLAN